MEGLHAPCVQVIASNIGPKAADIDSSGAGSLHNKIPICIGARVMLTEIVWTAVGLVNGALGHVYDVS
jgi:hypothetical protein